jgi:hypothetical protein
MESGWERRLREYERATPKWTDPVAILAIYTASRGQREGGWPVCVDHIVPLNHEYVCGLHCEDNLQVITELLNNAKSNNWWPDMWHEQFEMFEITEIEQYDLCL